MTSDLSGKWKKAAVDFTGDVLHQVSGYRKDVTLGPLRRAIGRVASLNKAINTAMGAPEEEGLRNLGRKLGMAKKELMALGWDLMLSQAPSLAAEAHKLVGEAEVIIKSSQREIKAALRKLGVASDLTETSSLDVPLPARGPVTGGHGEQPAPFPTRQ